MRHALRAFGLRLVSGLMLPGAMPDDAQVAPDVLVHQDTGHLTPRQPAATAEDPVSSGPYRLTGAELLFTMPGVARYRIGRAGTFLTVEPEPGVTTAELAAYAEATALPALLWLRGIPVLHAAGAVLPGLELAVAVAGISGAGKSTLLRRLIQEGAAAVGDDALALRAGQVSGLPAATQLAGPTRMPLPVPPGQQRESAQLGCVLELRVGGPGRPERQHGAEAAAVLLRNLHRARVLRLLRGEAALLPRVAETARTVPVFSWSAEMATQTSGPELARLVAGLLENR